VDKGGCMYDFVKDFKLRKTRKGGHLPNINIYFIAAAVQVELILVVKGREK
jgi:hypothetical protein